MKISIQKRKLSSLESKILEAETMDFIHTGFTSQHIWQKYFPVYVMAAGNKLIGIVNIVGLNEWMKIGPVVILAKYQGKGYGGKILKHVVSDMKNNNLYIGSSNPYIWRIVEGLGFERLDNYLKLPREIKIYLLKYFLERLNFEFIINEAKKIREKKRTKYRFYARKILG